MVYGLLKCKIILDQLLWHADLFWIERVCHCDGLECDRPEEPAIKKTLHKESNKRKVKKDGLLGIVGPSYKVKDLIADLKNKDIPKHYREKLCLVWFVHFVLLERDVKKVIERDLLEFTDDFGKFNDYPWGYDSYYLTVKYLLKELKPKTTTLYGFPWAFMHVVHPWLVPTIDELGMTSFLTLGLVDTKEYPTVELIKKELDGAISIRRAIRQGQSNVEALHDQTQTATEPGASSGGVAGGVICDSGSHPVAASAASRDYEHVGAQQKINMFENTPCTGPLSHPYTGPSHPYSGPSYPSSPSCSHCKCKVCKDRENKLLDKLETIDEATEELKSRRGVIPSNEVREPYTPTVEVRRKRRKIRKILSVLKLSKIATPPVPIVVEVQGPPKKVDIFAALGKEKKKELEEFIKIHHAFICHQRLFSNLTYMCMWYEDKVSLLLITYPSNLLHEEESTHQMYDVAKTWYSVAT
ncbi:hypothetical protein P3S67_001472 [Capsicum chacoense]